MLLPAHRQHVLLAAAAAAAADAAAADAVQLRPKLPTHFYFSASE